MKTDVFLNLFLSFKHKIVVFIFPYFLIYKIVQMSQVEGFCTEKTCLSHMYDTSVCGQHMLNNQIHIKLVVLMVAILSLNCNFD